MFLFVCLFTVPNQMLAVPEESKVGGILLLRHGFEMGWLFLMITVDAMSNQNSCAVIH